MDFAITWVCPNCGQSYFGKSPPDMCDYCQDFTTWRRIESASGEHEPNGLSADDKDHAQDDQ